MKWPYKKLGVQEIDGKVVRVLGWLTGDTVDGQEVPIPVYEHFWHEESPDDPLAQAIFRAE